MNVRLLRSQVSTEPVDNLVGNLFVGARNPLSIGSFSDWLKINHYLFLQ